MTTPHKWRLEDWWSTKSLGEVTLSPDGRRVAFVISRQDKEKNDTFNTIFLLLLDENGEALAEPRQLTSGLKSDSHPIWSPDSRKLLFKSNREDGSQLWLIDTDGGEARKLTNLLYGVGEAAWSPDGKQIAFTAPTVSDVEDDILLGRKSLDEESKKKQAEQQRLRLRTINKLWYRLDGVGLFDRVSHLFVMPAPETSVSNVDAAHIRRLTSGDHTYFQPQWTPDSQEISILRQLGEQEEAFTPDLWIINVESTEARRLTEGNLEISTYAWAPDSRAAVVVAAETRPFSDLKLARLYLVTRQGNVGDRTLCISPDFAYDANITVSSTYGVPGPYRPQWSNDGQSIYFLASQSGCAHIYRLDVVWRSIAQISSGTEIIRYLALLPDGQRLLYAQETAEHPWELYCVSLPAEQGSGEAKRLTHLYDQWVAERHWGQAERVTYTGAQGDEIEGWLIQPVGARPGVRYPLIVRIHGGPNSAYGIGNILDPLSQSLAAQGYAIFFCNPHGSTSYGEKFLQSGLGDWGGMDFQDIMLGVDECIRRGSVDPERLGVMGSSYGGYMTMFIVGHSDRFKAAVPTASVSNLQSFVGTSDLGFWLSWQSKGYPWDIERQDYYRERSPISSVTNVTTPTLIIHGEDDLRCPIEQSEQFYVALKTIGKAPVEFIRMPASWHGGSEKPSQYPLAWEKTIEWFNTYLGGQPED
ncbi:S9 family peptidase [Dictyobacter kobayashii]|uniref:Putative peptidase YuxL n=1 Tax=Dictyobacter kobayashii TaxID=2014872 RepID=A0A402AWD1_9CHLR|nr:S9 family peptidase [Dictyobacter kobayashii]GCE23377.1 putative peptidase YuxL [Dictyobacter kobayashii]